MSSLLYREFALRSPQVWPAIVAFVKGNAAAIWERGRFLRVIITEEDRARTSQQNRFFHGPFLDRITECAWWGGRQYPKEFWKEYLRRRFLLKEEFTTPDGEIIQVYWSTSDLNVAQFTEFLEKSRAEMATEFGVEFDGL